MNYVHKNNRTFLESLVLNHVQLVPKRYFCLYHGSLTGITMLRIRLFLNLLLYAPQGKKTNILSSFNIFGKFVLFLWTEWFPRNFHSFVIILPLDISEIFNIFRIRVFSSLREVNENLKKKLKTVVISKRLDAI